MQRPRRRITLGNPEDLPENQNHEEKASRAGGAAPQDVPAPVVPLTFNGGAMREMLEEIMRQAQVGPFHRFGQSRGMKWDEPMVVPINPPAPDVFTTDNTGTGSVPMPPPYRVTFGALSMATT